MDDNFPRDHKKNLRISPNESFENSNKNYSTLPRLYFRRKRNHEISKSLEGSENSNSIKFDETEHVALKRFDENLNFPNGNTTGENFNSPKDNSSLGDNKTFDKSEDNFNYSSYNFTLGNLTGDWILNISEPEEGTEMARLEEKINGTVDEEKRTKQKDIKKEKELERNVMIAPIKNFPEIKVKESQEIEKQQQLLVNDSKELNLKKLEELEVKGVKDFEKREPDSEIKTTRMSVIKSSEKVEETEVEKDIQSDYINMTLLNETNSSENDTMPIETEEEILRQIRDFIFPKAWTWVLIFFHALVFVIGLVGNTLVCVSVYRNHSMRTVTNYFIVNLAIADFLVILFCLPPTVIWDVTMTWFFGVTMCKITLYLQVS